MSFVLAFLAAHFLAVPLTLLAVFVIAITYLSVIRMTPEEAAKKIAYHLELLAKHPVKTSMPEETLRAQKLANDKAELELRQLTTNVSAPKRSHHKKVGGS